MSVNIIRRLPPTEKDVIDMRSRIQRRAMTDRGRSAFAIGAGCVEGTFDPNSSGRDECWDGQRFCDMQRISGSSIDAGGGQWVVTVLPTETSWFQPKRVRAVVVNNDNTIETLRTVITAVTINNHAQEARNEINPTAATEGWASDDYSDPDAYGIPVGWGAFSTEAHNHVLRIYGFHVGIAAGVNVRTMFSIIGNGLDSKPTGAGMPVCQAGTPRGSLSRYGYAKGPLGPMG